MRKKLTNSMVEAFNGDGSASAHPVLWCGELPGRSGIAGDIGRRNGTYPSPAIFLALVGRPLTS
jgi:hypothetical protein